MWLFDKHINILAARGAGGGGGRDRGHHPRHRGRPDRESDQQGAVRQAPGRGQQEQDLQMWHL